MTGIAPITMGIIAPQKDNKRAPWILDETPTILRDPKVIMNERMKEEMLEKAKSKPDKARNFFDYLLLAQEKLEKMQNSTVCYLA